MESLGKFQGQNPRGSRPRWFWPRDFPMVSLGTLLENGESMKPSPLVELNPNMLVRDVERMNTGLRILTHQQTFSALIVRFVMLLFKICVYCHTPPDPWSLDFRHHIVQSSHLIYTALHLPDLQYNRPQHFLNFITFSTLVNSVTLVFCITQVSSIKLVHKSPSAMSSCFLQCW